uniref:Uncharacterized protein n=1 Tax=Arundo donax TaxID=35708 RepID=A0A0A9F6L0_ARUDO
MSRFRNPKRENELSVDQMMLFSTATGKACTPQCAPRSRGIFVYGHPSDYGL